MKGEFLWEEEAVHTVEADIPAADLLADVPAADLVEDTDREVPVLEVLDFTVHTDGGAVRFFQAADLDGEITDGEAADVLQRFSSSFSLFS